MTSHSMADWFICPRGHRITCFEYAVAQNAPRLPDDPLLSRTQAERERDSEWEEEYIKVIWPDCAAPRPKRPMEARKRVL